jgi:lambda repressor-like predicted transcriptional regulator
MAKSASDSAEPEPQPITLWDEARFQTLVRKAAKRKGIALGEVARLAGTSAHWLTQPATTTGRGVEKILQIANVLDLDPVELLTGRQHSERSTADERLRILTTVATVTAHLVVALQSAERTDSDRIIRVAQRAVLQVLKEIEAGETGNS